jgi:protein-tyrosine phosphatase
MGWIICGSINLKSSCLEEILNNKKGICFVCAGNIVRSPLAQHLFIRHVRQAGLEEKYLVGSGGTGGWHVGESPDSRMRRVAARKGLVYDGQARQFQHPDFGRYDMIIAMDTENRDFLQSLARNEEEISKIRLMREFDPEGGPNASVPDPYYGGIEGFEDVYKILERSTRALLAALENESNENSK